MKTEYTMPRAADAQAYLDAALARASKRASNMTRGPDRVSKAKNAEYERFRTIQEALITSISHVLDAYPSFDQVSEFTKQLFELDLEVGRVKQALGHCNNAIRVLRSLTRDHLALLKTAYTVESVARIRSTYIGRVSSVMKQLKSSLEILNHAREVFRGLPSLDDELFTVAIAGFPNVGKSTLLSKMTTAKPEIKPYAFTTKGLNVGYFDYRYNQIQCIDTPGTLNRKHANAVERKAEITLKYLAHVIVYVFDPTETSYPLSEQKTLYECTKEIGKTVLVYISKTDIADKTVVDEIRKDHDAVFTDPELVRKELTVLFRKEFV